MSKNKLHKLHRNIYFAFYARANLWGDLMSHGKIATILCKLWRPLVRCSADDDECKIEYEFNPTVTLQMCTNYSSSSSHFSVLVFFIFLLHFVFNFWSFPFFCNNVRCTISFINWPFNKFYKEIYSKR